MPEEFDFWRFMAGLGIFLFGMFLMEESVRKLSGRGFRRLIRNYTRGKFRSIGVGIFSTALLQSSSAVSLMVLAFVGAGVMEMTSAIGVIMGSNLGTTITGWIVATLGFSMKIDSFALPMIGIGGLGVIFLGKSERYSNISKLLVGFGFLFLGLDYMKEGVAVLAGELDLQTFQGYNLFVFVGIGFLLTVLMQSSSATLAIVLTTLHAGLITFDSGAGVVIGANIGTTFTIILGAIGATQVKKRVAFSHVLFNLTTGLVALALVPVFSWLIQDLMDMKDNPVTGIALFHTFFNLLGVILFLPLMGLLAKLLLKVFKDKTNVLSTHISELPPGVPDADLSALRKETLHLLKRALVHNLLFMQIDPRLAFSPNFLPNQILDPQKIKDQDMFASILELQSEIFSFAAEAQKTTLTEDETIVFNRLLHACRQAVYSSRTLRDASEEFLSMEGSELRLMAEIEQRFKRRMIEAYLVISRLLLNPKGFSASDLTEFHEQIRKKDKAFVEQITLDLGSKKLDSKEVPALLMINRAMSQSLRQILNAIGELDNDAEEADTYLRPPPIDMASSKVK